MVINITYTSHVHLWELRHDAATNRRNLSHSGVHTISLISVLTLKVTAIAVADEVNALLAGVVTVKAAMCGSENKNDQFQRKREVSLMFVIVLPKAFISFRCS